MRLISLTVVLFLFWLALSGHYTPFLLAAGVGSAFLCALVGARLRIVDAEGHPVHLAWNALTYFPWLLWEIAKSAWAVTKVILHPRLPISPTMTKVIAGQKSAVGIATYANSITLTPGTITTGVNGNVLTVHALVRDGAVDLEGGGMDARVSQFEGKGGLMFAAAACAVLVALVLAVVRALKGPTVFDRVLAGNSVGTLAILLLAVVGFLTGRPEWLDIAITYGLLNVISTLAILKFFRHGDLAYDAEEEIVVMQAVLDVVSWALILAGSFFTVVGAIGLVRMPDVYTRMHAASVTDTLGAGLLLAGLMVQAGLGLVTLKLLVILILFFFMGPVATHALAQAALHAGVRPQLSEDRTERLEEHEGAVIEALINMVLLTLLAAVTIGIVRTRNLFGVIVLAGIYSFLMASVLIVLDAVDVAMTEAAVGAGVSTVLLLATLHLTKSMEYPRPRKAYVPLFVAIGTGAAIVWGTYSLPSFGTPDNVIHKHVVPRYLADSIKETMVPNVVTSVLADYRGYDTLGETTVIFTAGIGVLLLLKGRRRRRADEAGGGNAT